MSVVKSYPEQRFSLGWNRLSLRRHCQRVEQSSWRTPIAVNQGFPLLFQPASDVVHGAIEAHFVEGEFLEAALHQEILTGRQGFKLEAVFLERQEGIDAWGETKNALFQFLGIANHAGPERGDAGVQVVDPDAEDVVEGSLVAHPKKQTQTASEWFSVFKPLRVVGVLAMKGSIVPCNLTFPPG